MAGSCVDYLNNAVYLFEDRLKELTGLEDGIGPDGSVLWEVDYGSRKEHCWNGDQDNGNGISRLRYNTMYLPRIMARIAASAPPGADVTSWRYN